MSAGILHGLDCATLIAYGGVSHDFLMFAMMVHDCRFLATKQPLASITTSARTAASPLTALSGQQLQQQAKKLKLFTTTLRMWI